MLFIYLFFIFCSFFWFIYLHFFYAIYWMLILQSDDIRALYVRNIIKKSSYLYLQLRTTAWYSYEFQIYSSSPKMYFIFKQLKKLQKTRCLVIYYAIITKDIHQPSASIARVIRNIITSSADVPNSGLHDDLSEFSVNIVDKYPLGGINKNK